MVKPYLSGHNTIVEEVKNQNGGNTIFVWSQHHNRMVKVPYYSGFNIKFEWP